ncbi:MAG: protein of unknown function transrane [Deferribacteraceae bacterium]|nr:protein of unknown function transrane [Deferribacteraceae bacterium]
MTGLALVIFSAFTHSLWNILLKKSNNKFVFNYQMHIINLIIFTIFMVFFGRDMINFEFLPIFLGFFAAVFFALYHLSLSNSYVFTDVSLAYPVSTSSPILVAIWARLLLGEQFTVSGLLGILIIFIGIFTMHMSRLKGKIDNKGIFFALLASLFYSFGAIIDKFGVTTNSFMLYIYSVVFFMTLFLFVQANIKYGNHIMEFSKNKKYVLLGGGIIFLSFLSYRIGLTYMNVSYATALRQVNSLFGLLIGYYFLKEKISVTRFVGAFLILSGAVLIKINL